MTCSEAIMLEVDPFFKLLEGGHILSPKSLRLIGIIFLITAAVLAVLNLKRVAGLGTPLLWAPFLVIGWACVTLARRRK